LGLCQSRSYASCADDDDIHGLSGHIRHGLKYHVGDERRG
jgi:hypothetical protein